MEFQLIKPINESYTALEQVLTNRGIQFKDIPHYLNLSEVDNLSPSLLMNIEDAISILMKHLLTEESEILVIVD